MKVCIVSKGRSHAKLTYNYLVEGGIDDIEIFVYEDDVLAYEKVCPKANIIVGDYTTLALKRRYIMQRHIDLGTKGFFMMDDDINLMQLKLLRPWHTGTKIGKPVEITTKQILQIVEKTAHYYDLALASATYQSMAALNLDGAIYRQSGRVNGCYYVNNNKLRELDYNPYWFDAPATVVEDQKMTSLLYKNEIPFMSIPHWYFGLPKHGSQTGGNVDMYLEEFGGEWPEESERMNAYNRMVKTFFEEEINEGLISFPVRSGKMLLQFTTSQREIVNDFNLKMYEFTNEIVGKKVYYRTTKNFPDKVELVKPEVYIKPEMKPKSSISLFDI